MGQQRARQRHQGGRGHRAVQRPDVAEHVRYDLPCRLLAELMGTFALTFVAAGAPVIAAASHTPPNLVALVVAPALLVMAMIYTIGGVSGAHFNPTVTLAFTLRQDFPWRWVPWYWAMQ